MDPSIQGHSHGIAQKRIRGQMKTRGVIGVMGGGVVRCGTQVEAKSVPFKGFKNGVGTTNIWGGETRGGGKDQNLKRKDLYNEAWKKRACGNGS